MKINGIGYNGTACHCDAEDEPHTHHQELPPWKPRDCFTRKSGSKVWPSNDPGDSPNDIFTCDQCGYTFQHQAYGTRSIDEMPFEEAIEMKMQRHIFAFHMENK